MLDLQQAYISLWFNKKHTRSKSPRSACCSVLTPQPCALLAVFVSAMEAKLTPALTRFANQKCPKLAAASNSNSNAGDAAMVDQGPSPPQSAGRQTASPTPGSPSRR